MHDIVNDDIVKKKEKRGILSNDNQTDWIMTHGVGVKDDFVSPDRRSKHDLSLHFTQKWGFVFTVVTFSPCFPRMFGQMFGQ